MLDGAQVVKTRSGNRNPMRDRASVKDKPMTATATSLVRSIWQSYFPTTSAPSEGGGEPPFPSQAAHCCSVDEQLAAKQSSWLQKLLLWRLPNPRRWRSKRT